MQGMKAVPEFIGLDTEYLTADGGSLPRLHLDGAASPLACRAAVKAMEEVLPHYSNTHSYVHNSARIVTQAFDWAHRKVFEYLDADPNEYTVIFTGSGTTAGINRVARGLHNARPSRNKVLVSAMEHHANDLPHRQFGNEVIYIPLLGEGASMGIIDMQAFQTLCEQHHNELNYVAVSSVSNVTGVRNPVMEMTRIAHDYDIPMVVDGAQAVAHGPTGLSERDVDFFVFSGHKVYTPMSPGVLVAKQELLQTLPGQDLGGGSVDTVSYYDYQMLAEYPHREESGTPNIIGAIALAAVLNELMDYGLERVEQHDDNLVKQLLQGLTALDEVTVYADHKLSRTGALAFNVKGMDHGLVAAILNDYYAIAVRNECFCAHPYVSSLIKEELWALDLADIEEDQQEAYINRKRGMVRASVSLYNTEQDVERFLSAIKMIIERGDDYDKHYSVHDDGSYTHNSFQLDWREQLTL